MAVKLLRTFALQAEALAKLRRGGEQTVRVEHVHVYPGGQAVVGNVTHHGRPGRGGAEKNARQPHGPTDIRALAVAPGAPMWGTNTAREPVPVADGAGLDTVPAPRRRQG